MSNVVIVIPARYESSRFPGKPLVTILGVPLVVRVADVGSLAVGKANVYIATDDDRIAQKCKEHGYSVIMTSRACLTGTDRVAEASRKIAADIFVNVQGDEPMLNPKDIIKCIETKEENPQTVVMGMADLSQDENPSDLKIPKVVVNNYNELLYTSRNAIPSSKTGLTKKAKKQVCVYVFNRQELEKFIGCGQKTPLEQSEDLEILRFIELGITVKMVEVSSNTHAVDCPEDIAIVENLLGNYS